MSTWPCGENCSVLSERAVTFFWLSTPCLSLSKSTSNKSTVEEGLLHKQHVWLNKHSLFIASELVMFGSNTVAVSILIIFLNAFVFTTFMFYQILRLLSRNEYGKQHNIHNSTLLSVYFYPVLVGKIRLVLRWIFFLNNTKLMKNVFCWYVSIWPHGILERRGLFVDFKTYFSWMCI